MDIGKYITTAIVLTSIISSFCHPERSEGSRVHQLASGILRFVMTGYNKITHL